VTDLLLAYCGLSCAQCPAYIATQTDDQELRTKTATEWSSESFTVSPDELYCDGCSTTAGKRWTWCNQCTVRACASERQVTTCAACPDYGCDTLESFLQMAGTEARQRLEALRLTA
jgi:hypothetical protein